MKHSLAIFASLVASFVFGAVVALYGFGPSATADVGCYAYRMNGVQYDDCMEEVINSCPNPADRSAFVACFKSRMQDKEMLIRDSNLHPAGEQQKVMPGRKADDQM